MSWIEAPWNPRSRNVASPASSTAATVTGLRLVGDFGMATPFVRNSLAHVDTVCIRYDVYPFE